MLRRIHKQSVSENMPMAFSRFSSPHFFSSNNTILRIYNNVLPSARTFFIISPPNAAVSAISLHKHVRTRGPQVIKTSVWAQVSKRTREPHVFLNKFESDFVDNPTFDPTGQKFDRNNDKTTSI